MRLHVGQPRDGQFGGALVLQAMAQPLQVEQKEKIEKKAILNAEMLQKKTCSLEKVLKFKSYDPVFFVPPMNV